MLTGRESVWGIQYDLLVEMIRDPRDILASKKTRRETAWTDRYSENFIQTSKHLEKAYDPVWDTLSWRAAIVNGLRAHRDYADKILTIRYEDLVNEPEAAIDRLCRLLALSYSDELANISFHNAADRSSVSVGDKAISVRSVGRWRQSLRPSEVSVCQILTRRELELHAYKLEPTSSGMFEILALFMRSQWNLLQRIYR